MRRCIPAAEQLSLRFESVFLPADCIAPGVLGLHRPRSRALARDRLSTAHAACDTAPPLTTAAVVQAAGVAKVCEGLHTTRLAHVDLSDNGLADDGAAALADKLPRALLGHLRHLALASNGIDAAAAEPLATLLAEAAPALTSLALGDNDLEVRAACAVRAALALLAIGRAFVRPCTGECTPRRQRICVLCVLQCLLLRRCGNRKFTAAGRGPRGAAAGAHAHVGAARARHLCQ